MQNFHLSPIEKSPATLHPIADLIGYVSVTPRPMQAIVQSVPSCEENPVVDGHSHRGADAIGK
jgi:hypothetical protein